jgi:hypothetical protein
VLSHEGPAQSEYVISETLRIDGEAGAELTRVLETRPVSGPVRRFTLANPYRVEIEDDHLLLFFVCPINAVCTMALIPPARAYREPGGRLRVEGIAGLGPRLFDRGLDAFDAR